MMVLKASMSAIPSAQLSGYEENLVLEWVRLYRPIDPEAYGICRVIYMHTLEVNEWNDKDNLKEKLGFNRHAIKFFDNINYIYISLITQLWRWHTWLVDGLHYVSHWYLISDPKSSRVMWTHMGALFFCVSQVILGEAKRGCFLFALVSFSLGNIPPCLLVWFGGCAVELAVLDP